MTDFFVKNLIICALMLVNSGAYSATVIAASVLPQSAYTRITIESDQVIARTVLVLKNPDRIVLDLKNTPINSALKTLAGKVLPDDFYIKQLRVASFKQGVTRIVVDLKAEAKPKLSVYAPSGEYQHRLALDIYPATIADAGADNSPNISESAPVVDRNPSGSKSSGAKIILDAEPAYEPEEDLDLSQ